MSEKSPKTPFKLLVPNALMNQIDHFVSTDDYNNRSEFIMRAVGDYVDKLNYVQDIHREYIMFEDGKKKESSHDESEE